MAAGEGLFVESMTFVGESALVVTRVDEPEEADVSGPVHGVSFGIRTSGSKLQKQEKQILFYPCKMFFVISCTYLKTFFLSNLFCSLCSIIVLYGPTCFFGQIECYPL